MKTRLIVLPKIAVSRTSVCKEDWFRFDKEKEKKKEEKEKAQITEGNLGDLSKFEKSAEAAHYSNQKE